MKCARCNSENVQMQAKPAKKPIVLGCVLAVGGFGMMVFGILGALIGSILGLVVGGIVKAIVPASDEVVAVCQDCGYASKPIDQKIKKANTHSTKSN